MKPATRLLVTIAGAALAAFSVIPVRAQSEDTPIVSVQAHRRTNIRSGPSVTYSVVGKLAQDETASVIGRSDEFGNWLQIDLNGVDGWVASLAVDVSGNLESIPIVRAETRGANEPPARAARSSPAGDQSPSSVIATAYRVVNVRLGPGTDFPVLGTLSPGDTANVIGTSGEDNEWLQIDFSGEVGWVAYFVVTLSGELDALAVVEAEAMPPDTASIESGIVLNQVIVITRFNTNLRAEPRYGAEILDVVPWETTLEAQARTADNRWLQVNYEGQAGWLIASLVNTGVSEVDALPVIDVPAPETTPAV